MKRIDVLNLEWSTQIGRDRQVTALVCNYLRYMNYSVEEYSCFDAIRKIKKYKPKLLFISSSIGTPESFKIVKYAKSKNIKVLTLISEGNALMIEEFVKNKSFWGNNIDQILYEDINLVWSQKHYKAVIKYWSEIKSKIKVGGGVGFDNYVLSPQKDKYDFLKKYQKEKYQKVIGLGCWYFGFINPKDINHNIFAKNFTKDDFKRFEKDRQLSNQILIDIVVKNPNILFLIKEHPGGNSKYYSAIEGLEGFKNVLILKNEESIFDCISISDFWLSYESTTAIEAWMIGKKTALINPTGIDFVGRANVHNGQPNYARLEALQNAIDVFYTTNKLPHFDDEQYKVARKTIIKESIQWDDGLNHIRSGNEVIDLLNREVEKVEIKNPPTWWLIKQSIRWVLSPYLRFIEPFKTTYQTHYKKWNNQQLKEYSEKKMQDQIEFYKSKNLMKEDLLKIKAI